MRNKTYYKRTLRPLYHSSSTLTPMAELVEPDDRIIVPGMVATKLDNGNVTLASLGDKPYGLFCNYVNGELDELGGMTDVGIWRSNGVFEVLSHDQAQPFAGIFIENYPVFWNDVGQLWCDWDRVPWYPEQPSIGHVVSASTRSIYIDVSFP